MPRHALSDKSKLHIYRASAGSGKTHRLTAEYLSLLLRNSSAYRHILAVTFTNKATDEMKTRIIQELAKLAKGEKSDYTSRLTREHKLSEENIRNKAKETLTNILHDYSAFSVSTIDRFFQQTMRAFTREIGLGGGYNVELDTDKVLSEAIDSLLFDLEKSENKQLLSWLIRFSEEKVENGDTWNIRNDIHSLSSEIFKETYKAYSAQVREDIGNKELMDDYKKTLSSTLRSFETESQRIGEKALNIIARSDLSIEDFKGGTRSPFKHFMKWANGEIEEPTKVFRSLRNDLSNWCAVKAPGHIRNKIEGIYADGLNDCVDEIVNLYENSQDYQSAYEINRYFFTLGILGDIDKKICEIASESNIMLISDTTELLNKIIQGNDAPFIYEKVGLRINHYMIDEFQDTSRMQWENFRPLLQESLGNGNVNYIVGDVKQSIYRWRNSDWRLLDEQLDADFPPERINHETLDTNWRSACNVIDFNNAVFTKGARLLQGVYNAVLPESDSRHGKFSERILKAYADLYQETPASRLDNKGHVKVEFVDTAEHDWQSYVLEQLPEQIEHLQDKGYNLRDIAILVRTKKEGAEVANRLLEYKNTHPGSKYRYDIISDEALYLNSSRSVKLIIGLLKYLHNTEDHSLKAIALFEYFKYEKRLNVEEALHEYFSAGSDFPEAVSKELDRIKRLSLYEMIEEIYALFFSAMEENEQIYIQSFLDQALDFTSRQSSDLDAFLKWWDETGINKTIYTPDGQDAIRIMTIHKSKGLGFNVVLIPFCNWEIDHKLSTILWCHPQKAPFNKLRLVPVKYSQKLKNTIFKNEHLEERLNAFVDNFNILYVAFTRAKNELIAYCPKPKKNEINNIASLLWNCITSTEMHDPCQEGQEIIDLKEFHDGKNDVMEIGEVSHVGQKHDESSSVEEISIDILPSTSFEEKLRLSLKNKYFFTDKGKRDYGVLMHEIVSKIKTLTDVDLALDSFYRSGDITASQKDEMETLIKSYLANPVISEWYSGNYKILNEVQILLPDGKRMRPDRVMLKDNEVVVIDYKFGEKKDNKYIRQIKYYKDCISKMGFVNIKGYICYVKQNDITEV